MFTVASALCGAGPVGRAARRRPGRPGPRRGDARAGLAGPGRRGLPRGAARPRHRRCGARRPPSPPASARRSVARWCELGGWRWAFLVNLPFGLVAVWAARSQLVESRAPGRRAHARPRRRGPARRQPGRCSTSASSRAPTGAGPAPQVLGSFVGAAVAARCCSCSARGAPLAAARPGPAAPARRSTIGSVATVAAGFGFYAYLLTNVLWLQYVWGYDVLQRRPRPRARGRRRGARRRPARARWPSATATASSSCPGALVWAARLPLVPPAGRARAGVLGRVDAGPGAQRHRRRRDPAPARQRGPRRGARGPLRHGVRGGLQRAPARRRARHRDPRRHPRRPHARPRRSRRSTRAGCSRSSRSSSSRCSPLPLGRIQLRARGRGRRRRPASPSSSRRTRRPSGPFPSSAGHARTTRPLRACRCSPRSPTTPGTASSARPGSSTLPAGACADARQGDPPGSAFVVRTGRLEVLVDGTVVRELGPGEVLGELALLTGEPRSADRARPPRHDPRSRSPARPSRTCSPPTRRRPGSCSARWPSGCAPPGGAGAAAPPPERVSVVAVVGVGTAVRRPRSPRWATRSAAGCASTSGSRTPAWSAPTGWRGPSATTTGSCSWPASSADGPDAAWRDFCLRQADAVVLVATRRRRAGDGAVAGPRAPPRPGAAGGGADARAAGGVGGRHRRLAAHPRRRRPRDRPAPVADRLAGRSLGLALAGGGARAFAHVGVLRELEDAGLHVDRVAGSEHRRGHRRPCTRPASTARPSRRSATPSSCGAGRSATTGSRVVPSPAGAGCSAGMERHFGADTVIEGLPRQLSVVSVDLVSRTRQVHRRGLLVDAALASARLPVLFAPLAQDDGRLLVDGGVLDNLPTDLLVERDEGPVVAVTIGAGGDGPRRPGRPRVPGPRRHPDAHDDDRQRRCGATPPGPGAPGSSGRRRWGWGCWSSTSSTGWCRPGAARRAAGAAGAGRPATSGGGDPPAGARRAGPPRAAAARGSASRVSRLRPRTASPRPCPAGGPARCSARGRRRRRRPRGASTASSRRRSSGCGAPAARRGVARATG